MVNELLTLTPVGLEQARQATSERWGLWWTFLLDPASGSSDPNRGVALHADEAKVAQPVPVEGACFKRPLIVRATDLSTSETIPA
jgi:hypothetical protein